MGKRKGLMAATAAAASRDQAPSGVESVPKSLQRLRDSITRSKAGGKSATVKVAKVAPMRKLGENFYQFSRRVDENTRATTAAMPVMAKTPSPSTASFRQRKKDKKRRKHIISTLDEEEKLPYERPHVNEAVLAPPRISMLPGKRAKTPVIVDAAQHHQDLVDKRQKDLLKERLQLAYKTAKQARHDRSTEEFNDLDQDLDRFT